MIIDTHVHLNDPRLLDNIDQIIQEAKEKDVSKIIVIGFDKASSVKALSIANQFPNVFCAIGIHPSEVKELEDDLSWIEELAKDEKVVAIGEIGLDYYWDTSFKEKQIDFFVRQLEIARKLNLPVSIHSRSATQETFDILESSGVTGVMHCYSGSLEMAKRFIRIGFYLGIGGVVTFKNAGVREVVEDIPIEYLLTETDAPYLAPVPHRGQTNYPKYTALVVEEIAKIKRLELDFVKRKLEENTYKIFRI